MSAAEIATVSPGIDRPTVTLLAYTEITDAAVDLLDVPGMTTGPDHLAEVAGRACYQSWDRLNPKTAQNADYLANVIGLGHESVLSHASATFYIEGVSRALTHELIRHRWLSFSELSQRYVDVSEFRPVFPPAADTSERASILLTFQRGVSSYARGVKYHEELGLTRKEARQAARSHLPLCTETKIVVSGNLRAWRDFLRQRLSPHADAEIRQLAQILRDQLLELAPATFADAAGWDS